jgi:hypothetical protein
MPVGAAGRWCGRTNRNPCRPSARSLLVRLVGGAALGKGRCHPRPDEPQSPWPTGPGVPGSVEFRWARLLWGEVSEVPHRHPLQSTGVELAPSSRLCLAVLGCGLRPGGRSTRRASSSSPGGEAAEGEQAPAPSSGTPGRTLSRDTWHRTCTNLCYEQRGEGGPKIPGALAGCESGKQVLNSCQACPPSTRPRSFVVVRRALPCLPGGGPKNRLAGSWNTSRTTPSSSSTSTGVVTGNVGAEPIFGYQEAETAAGGPPLWRRSGPSERLAFSWRARLPQGGGPVPYAGVGLAPMPGRGGGGGR